MHRSPLVKEAHSEGSGLSALARPRLLRRRDSVFGHAAGHMIAPGECGRENREGRNDGREHDEIASRHGYLHLLMKWENILYIVMTFDLDQIPKHVARL